MRVRDAVLAGGCVLLLTPAATLTLLRLTDPSGARMVQAVAFTPFALPLYAAALVLLVVVMVARRAVALPYLLPAAVATAGLGLHAVWFAPQVAGDQPPPAAGADTVVVMAANILRGRADGAELVDRVRERGVDLLVVSEITESSLAAMDAAGLTELLPHRAGRPAEDDAVTGTMVFSSDAVGIVEVLGTTMGSLVVDTGGLRLLAVHPSTPMSPDLWRDDHAAVLAAVEEHEPDVLAGDFNATLDHAPMRALRDSGFRDAVEITNGGFQPTWPVNGGFGLIGVLGPVAQIDHVLVGDGWTVTDTETTQLDGSDHTTVLAAIAAR